MKSEDLEVAVMEAQESDQSVLLPLEPRDPPGIRPATDWPGVVEKVQAIQRKLAEERAAKVNKKEPANAPSQ